MHTVETKKKMSLSKKGNTDGFKKGYIPWNKGKKIHFSEQHRKNITIAKTGGARTPITEETRKRLSTAMRGKLTGEKCHFWKGGISDLRDLIRHNFKYRQWRSDVYQRDDYTCQECGARSGNGKEVILNADHIKLFAQILKDNDIKTIESAVNCEELWNINNGRTLCQECHRKTESFGVKAHKLLK